MDPTLEEMNQPLMTLTIQQGINQIGWAGFATGVKTETKDRIRVGGLVLSRSWRDAYQFLKSGIRKPADHSIGKLLPKVVWSEPIIFRKDIYSILKNDASNVTLVNSQIPAIGLMCEMSISATVLANRLLFRETADVVFCWKC